MLKKVQKLIDNKQIFLVGEELSVVKSITEHPSGFLIFVGDEDRKKDADKLDEAKKTIEFLNRTKGNGLILAENKNYDKMKRITESIINDAVAIEDPVPGQDMNDFLDVDSCLYTDQALFLVIKYE